jgi:hypothetical protein
MEDVLLWLDWESIALSHTREYRIGRSEDRRSRECCMQSRKYLSCSQSYSLSPKSDEWDTWCVWSNMDSRITTLEWEKSFWITDNGQRDHIDIIGIFAETQGEIRSRARYHEIRTIRDSLRWSCHEDIREEHLLWSCLVHERDKWQRKYEGDKSRSDISTYMTVVICREKIFHKTKK